MNLLSHLRFRTKLGLLVGLSALALVISVGVGVGATMLRRRMRNDGIDKLHAVMQSTISLAQMLESRVASHNISREQALDAFHDDVYAIRFDDSSGYLSANNPNDVVAIHCVTPALGKKRAPATDEQGRKLSDLIHDSPGPGRASGNPKSPTSSDLAPGSDFPSRYPG